MAVLLDSGFLLASLNSPEAEHQATIEVLKRIREPIVLPIPAITEVAYLLARFDDAYKLAGEGNVDPLREFTEACREERKAMLNL